MGAHAAPRPAVAAAVVAVCAASAARADGGGGPDLSEVAAIVILSYFGACLCVVIVGTLVWVAREMLWEFCRPQSSAAFLAEFAELDALPSRAADDLDDGGAATTALYDPRELETVHEEYTSPPSLRFEALSNMSTLSDGSEQQAEDAALFQPFLPPASPRPHGPSPSRRSRSPSISSSRAESESLPPDSPAAAASPRSSSSPSASGGPREAGMWLDADYGPQRR